MGYTTKFSGCINLDRPLTLSEAKQLLTYNDDPDTIPKPNPGGYLQWVPNATLDAIGWDENEKFYDYVPWLQWVCDWLIDRQISANGSLIWSGEDASDVGTISVTANHVTATKGQQSKAGFRPITLEDLGQIALQRATEED